MIFMRREKTDWEKAVEFHGHECMGPAFGYRAAKAALKALGSRRAPDEELMSVVETDACGADALQVLTGCTLGKGNFVFCDYAKHFFTVIPGKARIFNFVLCAECGEQVAEARAGVKKRAVCVHSLQ